MNQSLFFLVYKGELMQVQVRIVYNATSHILMNQDECVSFYFQFYLETTFK